MMLPDLLKALKPVKDLAANCDIDISASLDEYLEKLEHETISFDRGETTLNFAQAAHVVQSCTCIYSKKVEYIHSLVFQVLDLITNRSKQGLKSSVDKDGNDEDAAFSNDNDDDDFLSLDDIQEGRNLYMKDDFDKGEKFQLLPEVPMCFASLEEDKKGDNPLYSKSGELLGSRLDFKLNTCHIHTSGTLLLYPSLLELLKKSLDAQLHDKVPDAVLDEVGEARNVQEVSGHEDDPNDDFPCLDEGGDGLDNQDPGADDHMDIGLDALLGPDDQQPEMIQDKRSTQKKQKKPAENPLKPMNIEEVRPPKPAVTGMNIIKGCPGLDKGSLKRKRTKLSPQIEPVNNWFKRKSYAVSNQKVSKRVLKTCSEMQEFDRQYFKALKGRQAIEREWMKKKKEIDRKALEEEEEEEEEERERLDVDEADFMGGAGNFGDFNEDPLDDDNFNGVDDMRQDAGFPYRGQDDIDDCEVDSYEDLVRKHVQEYMSSAAEYAQVMDLSKRVSEWEDKIIPRLQEEDIREPFDINRYGSQVINRLDERKTINFRSVVQGKPQFEVCRTFLATLMLANTENVRIEEKGSLEEGMDKFELELLSTKRHFEELQDYQAPSIS